MTWGLGSVGMAFFVCRWDLDEGSFFALSLWRLYEIMESWAFEKMLGIEHMMIFLLLLIAACCVCLAFWSSFLC